MYVMNYRKPRHKDVSTTLNCVSKASGHGPNPRCVVDPSVVQSYVTNIPSGYRKITTDEYVNIKYRTMCHGKGIYYQPSLTVVHLGLADAVVLGATKVESLDITTMDAYALDWQQAQHLPVLGGLSGMMVNLMFCPVWTAADPVEAAATLILTSTYEPELELARAVLEHKIVIRR